MGDIASVITCKCDRHERICRLSSEPNASSNPKLASIETLLRFSLIGSAVNRMPDTSSKTMRCTTTDNATN